jgi:hypothetical protein
MSVKTVFLFGSPIQALGNMDVQIGEAPPGTIMRITGAGGIVGQKPPTPANLNTVYAKQFIGAHFEFDERGHLAMFGSQGPAVGKEEDYERVKQLVGFHPEWTDAQDIAVLLKAGASYGPDERNALLKAIPLKELEKLFGKVTITSAEFETVTADDQRWALLHWLIYADIEFPDGTHRSYKLIFEPFKGALTSMEVISH